MSRICPITAETIPDGARYSSRGLALLSPRLTGLHDLPYTAVEQRREAAARAGRLSIQGVQPKLSAIVSLPRESFILTDRGGRYILKPQTELYPHLPENEDVTMRLATAAGIETPLHGLVYAVDGGMTYFIKRFDRARRKGKLALEDFAQLSGKSRETKYKSSMEQVAKVVEKYCTFPLPEKAKLFQRLIFSWLVGNEDMHLKNFSLLTRAGIVMLSPAYDLLNSTLVLRDPEELALPIRGRRNRLTPADLIDYYGGEVLGLTSKTVATTLGRFQRALPRWRELLGNSFLPVALKDNYRALVESRIERLGIGAVLHDRPRD